MFTRHENVFDVVLLRLSVPFLTNRFKLRLDDKKLTTKKTAKTSLTNTRSISRLSTKFRYFFHRLPEPYTCVYL